MDFVMLEWTLAKIFRNLFKNNNPYFSKNSQTTEAFRFHKKPRNKYQTWIYESQKCVLYFY